MEPVLQRASNSVHEFEKRTRPCSVVCHRRSLSLHEISHRPTYMITFFLLQFTNEMLLVEIRLLKSGLAGTLHAKSRPDFRKFPGFKLFVMFCFCFIFLFYFNGCVYYMHFNHINFIYFSFYFL